MINEQRYRKMIEKKMIFSIMYCLIGVAIIAIISLIEIQIPAFNKGLYYSLGVAGIIVGIMMAWKNTLLLRNAKYLRKDMIEVYDELNLKIKREAFLLCYHILQIFMVIAILISSFYSITVCLTLTCVIIVSYITFVISSVYIKRKLV